MAAVTIFRVGAWSVDAAARSVTNGAIEHTLSPRAVRVLEVLARAQGDVVSRSDLLDECWPNVIVSDESLSQVISELRRVFRQGEQDDPLIQTIPRSGYRLTAQALIEAPNVALDQVGDQIFDLDAYRLCLDARMTLSRSGPDSVERAEQMAREAAERAPGFALAQAEFAVILVQRSLYRESDAQGLSEALERAQKAVRLRPDLATAHASLGYAWGAFEHWGKAKQSFGHALACDRNDADVHYLAARTLFAARDYAGATALAERAAALDIDNYRPLYLASRTASAFDPLRARRLGEQTLKRVQSRLDADPNEPRAINVLGPLLAHLGEYDAATSSMDAEAANGCQPEFYTVVARCLIGAVPEAIQALEAIADRGWCHPSWLAAEPALAVLAPERTYQTLARQLGAA